MRLVVSDTGLTIEELTVMIAEAPTGATGQVDESPRIRLSGVASTLTEGDTDSFTVEVMGLTTTESYNLYTVPLNYNLAFNTDCDDHEQLESLSGRSSYTTSYTVHACSSPGSNLWSYLKQGSSYPATSGASNNWVSVSASQNTPEVTISSSSSSVTEGENIVFTVTANTATSSPLTVNVSVTQSGSFIDGTPATSVMIPANGTTARFTVQTDDDSADETNGSVTASIQAPTGYGLGSPSSVTVPVADNDGSSPDPEVTISSSQTSVIEGQNLQFTVTANAAPSSSLIVSVQLTDSGAFLDSDESRRFTVTIPANRTSVSFIVLTDDDTVDETNGSITARLWAGTGYDLGSSSSVSVTVEDNDEPAPQTPGGSWTTTLTSAYDSQSNEYGYYTGVYGTLSNQAFRYDGVVYNVDYIYWYQTSGQLEFGVTGCLKPSDFVSLSIDSTTYSSVRGIRSTDAQCRTDVTRRQEFEFHNVTPNPLTQENSYRITIALANDAITPVATVEPGTQEVFIGQSATLTASTSAEFGTVSSHQWQEWSSGQWTDLSSATSSSHVVTSSTSGVRTFRVRVTNSSTRQ